MKVSSLKRLIFQENSRCEQLDMEIDGTATEKTINLAQGGSFVEIPLADLPDFLHHVIDLVDEDRSGAGSNLCGLIHTIIRGWELDRIREEEQDNA